MMRHYRSAFILLTLLLLNIGAIVLASAISNEPPIVETLTPDQLSPQKTGAIITWTAAANDPEGDKILYRFLLKGPSTQGMEKVVRDWGNTHVWPWEAKEGDIGSSDITVQVRDESHPDAINENSIKTFKDYTISGKQQAFIDVHITNDVYSPADPRIYYCDEGGHLSIQNRIYLTGPDLNQVTKVKYLLPPSFSNKEIVSDDASNNFEIQLMSWGRFEMAAVVTTQYGQEFQIPFAFQFKSKVQEAQSRGIPMIRQCD